ncbi:adenylate/guanylate cyclase domain-containing protein [Nodularia spumigena CS-588/02]|uniref:CHASE2 domain-containing protein n=1 Tax=Nodularia spumigena TaxID=70799 RepID=UPI00232D74B6|nr:adenylate/guanylate cyclase domain-containing protein [Nodularia spumigena]MDB9359664.1 adenylate/guanylate cyclase domain-containing protein [Nodularia spumigena CS-588/02]MDB9365268.1 adenylate/guanylate cyclase domain-containing protein [Nodularia spumigena CS-588/02A10]
MSWRFLSLRLMIPFWRKFLRYIPNYLRRATVENHLLFPGILTALLSLGLWQIGAWQPLELLGFNLLFNVRYSLVPTNWDSRLAVIAIDDATLREYGEFPLSRDRYTQLLTTLEASLPAAIGFDILFIEPSPHDATLAQAMEINGQVVLAIAPSLQQQTLRPVPVLDLVTAKGHIVSNADLDGITRRYSLYIDQVPSLGMTLLQAYNHSLQYTFTPDTTNSHQSLITLPLPSLQSGETTAWINWVAPTQGTQGIATYSLIDVTQKKVDTAKLKNKILLVGLTATGTHDPLKTPFEQMFPTSGVYLHAAVIDNLLNQRLLQPLPQKFELWLLFAVGISSVLMLTPLQFPQRIFLLGLLPILWFSVSLLTLTSFNFWLPTAAPIGTILLSGLSVQWQEQKEKQQLMNLFARHVSQETATLIWQHRNEIFQNGKLEAKEMVATVLFTDIRKFTTISEGMKPRELLDWLNYYLGAMAECIQKHHGVVDKYIGDAIMAVFGIPFPHNFPEEIQQDAIQAVAAAISMQERLVLLNKELTQLGKPTISIGIGIHTGLVVAGSIGGCERLNYSVLGDAVNIAARLEQLNKNTQKGNPYNILVSETTFQLIKQHFSTQKVEQMQLRGRQQLTMIYSITGMQNS